MELIKIKEKPLLCAYIIIYFNIFLWVPWEHRDNFQVLHSSSFNTISFIRFYKAICLVLLLFITMPSAIRFFNRQLFNVIKTNVFYKEVFTFSVFAIIILYLFVQNIYFLATAYNYYNLCLMLSMFSTAAWLYHIFPYHDYKEMVIDIIMKAVFIFIMFLLIIFFANPASITMVAGNVTRLGSNVISPNHLADFGAFISLYIIYKLLYCGNKKSDYLFLVAGFSSVLLTRSAGAMVSMSIAIFILVFSSKNKIIGLYIIGIIVILCAAFFIEPVSNFLLRNIVFQDYLKKSTLTDRVDLWQYALFKLEGEKLLFGVGSGMNTIHFFLKSTSWGAAYAHNFFIQTLVEGGFVYFLLATLLVLGFLFDAKRLYKLENDKIGVFMLSCWVYSLLRAFVGSGFTGARTPFICVLFYLTIFQNSKLTSKLFSDY